MLSHRLRRWANIEPTPGERLVSLVGYRGAAQRTLQDDQVSLARLTTTWSCQPGVHWSVIVSSTIDLPSSCGGGVLNTSPVSRSEIYGPPSSHCCLELSCTIKSKFSPEHLAWQFLTRTIRTGVNMFYFLSTPWRLHLTYTKYHVVILHYSAFNTHEYQHREVDLIYMQIKESNSTWSPWECLRVSVIHNAYSVCVWRASTPANTIL